MYNKGDARERELVNLLWDNNILALRSPASGGGTKLPRPDIVIGRNGQDLAIELKSSSKDKIYIKQEEINKLKNFSLYFKCIVFIGIRFDYENWYFIKPEKVPRTKSGNYKITCEFIKKEGSIFDSFFSEYIEDFEE